MPIEQGILVENTPVAPDYYRLRLHLPKIARLCRPGQFVELTLSQTHDPLLPRPFSFMAADSRDIWILYRALGKGTGLLAKMRLDAKIRVLGPLGNGFAMPAASGRGGAADQMVLVGGGVGIPPLHHLAAAAIASKKIAPKNIRVFLGSRSAAHLLCEKEFKKMSVSLTLVTEDGSKGSKGLVTQPLERLLRASAGASGRLWVYACGPVPMLSAVAALCEKVGIACQVSLEAMMACGFGACLGCAVELKPQEEGLRYATVCKDGPVFDSKDILWR
ncbi:MAG: dihydroorotate dehydrogenase electron transfer subunit [Candidatus Omnitrophota bacterium]